jgi:hypothetical protein
MTCHRYICGGGRRGQHGVNSYDMLVWLIKQIHVWWMEKGSHVINKQDMVLVAYHDSDMSQIHVYFLG